ncbi:hypothetical protein V6N13_132279 [Hibiscus sabdariffa]|uniref:Uncharacterized protein n=1 Tax=Hibiscus sabdariffa TaxID=183260 RepID=A0ABR2PV20_9ROSI
MAVDEENGRWLCCGGFGTLDFAGKTENDHSSAIESSLIQQSRSMEKDTQLLCAVHTPSTRQFDLSTCPRSTLRFHRNPARAARPIVPREASILVSIIGCGLVFPQLLAHPFAPFTSTYDRTVPSIWSPPLPNDHGNILDQKSKS